MAATQTQKIWLAAIAIAVVLAAIFLAFHFGKSADSARAQLLEFVPVDASSIVLLDVDQLRTSPFLATLYSWAPQATEDSDYTQFMSDTGFNYERDLSQVLIAISNSGATSRTLVLAEGKFDRKKIEAYLSRNSQPTKQGSLVVFQVSAKTGTKPASFAFLSDHRVAISDSENLQQVLSARLSESARTEWQARFHRLAGSPIFAVIRQDPAIQNVVANQSPQLAAFIGQLPWITLAARPEGDILRVVAEGETITDTAATQLRDFLQGIQLLAEGGLNDPKLRQQMDPDERAAYVELLKNTEIEKISRADSKSVRIVLPVTPRLLEIARTAPMSPRTQEEAVPKEQERHRSGRKERSR
jgi:FlaG/FlaF family flagellin (archaellin)